MTPRLIRIPSAQYHADDIGEDRPSLSSSVATEIVRKSAFHGWLKHPKLGKATRKTTADQAYGTLIHSLVLDPDDAADQVVVVEADNFRTKAAQAERDDALAAGKTPILVGEMTDAYKVADEIKAAIAAAGFELTGQSEVAIVWEEDTPHGPIVCRGLIDHLLLDRPAILDLKTCNSAHPNAIAKSVTEHGYHIQACAYTKAIQQYRPDLAGRVELTWLFVEILPEESPRRVILTVAKPDGMMRELGRIHWDRACETWSRCLKDNHWPAYVTGIASISPKPWELKEEMGDVGEV